MAKSVWSIVSPQAATNYVINPSTELWSGGASAVPDGWTSVGATAFGRTNTPSTYVWRGGYSCHLTVTSGFSGMYQEFTLSGSMYTASCYIYVNTGQFIIALSDKGGGGVLNNVPTVGTGWQRLVINRAPGNGGLRLYIEANNQAADCFVDAIQLEDGASATTYFDGYEHQPGSWWNGAAHLSTSGRDGQCRDGGLPVDITTYMDKITNVGGQGKMPQNVASLAMGLAGGEIYQRSTNLARRMIFTGNILGSSQTNLEHKRNGLINLTDAHLVTPEQSFVMTYNNGVAPVDQQPRIRCVYEGGLEANWPVLTSFNHAEMGAQMRVVAHDPLFFSDKCESVALGYSQTVTNANYVLMRGNGGDPTQVGVWQAMGTGSAGGDVRCIIYNPVDGYWYVGGTFTSMGGVANTAYIAKWTVGNPGSWSAIGTGVTAGTNVYCLAVDAAGNVYAGGSFSTMGGVANTSGIAMWNRSVWAPLTTGVTSGTRTVGSITINPKGIVYVTGYFSTMGSVANTVCVAAWSGGAWSALSTGMTAGTNVITSVIGADGYLYLTGLFTQMGGVNCNGMAKWDGSAFTPLGSGITGGGVAMAVNRNGTLFISGDFTAAGGVACNRIAAWNGTAYIPLGSGLNNSGGVGGLVIHPKNGTLYVGGFFTAAGGVAMPDSMAIWTGTSFVPLDVKLPSSPAYVKTFAFDKFGNLAVGFSTSGSATSATVTVPANASTKCYPVIWLYGPGTLVQIVNYTTGRAIYFNNLTLQTGEVVVLILTPGQVRLVSFYRGDINNAILQGSSLDFYLQPGNNNISCYVTGASINPVMVWHNTYNAADGVA